MNAEAQVSWPKSLDTKLIQAAEVIIIDRQEINVYHDDFELLNVMLQTSTQGWAVQESSVPVKHRGATDTDNLRGFLILCHTYSQK